MINVLCQTKPSNFDSKLKPIISIWVFISFTFNKRMMKFHFISCCKFFCGQIWCDLRIILWKIFHVLYLFFFLQTVQTLWHNFLFKIETNGMKKLLRKKRRLNLAENHFESSFMVALNLCVTTIGWIVEGSILLFHHFCMQLPVKLPIENGLFVNQLQQWYKTIGEKSDTYINASISIWFSFSERSMASQIVRRSSFKRCNSVSRSHANFSSSWILSRTCPCFSAPIPT